MINDNLVEHCKGSDLHFKYHNIHKPQKSNGVSNL